MKNQELIGHSLSLHIDIAQIMKEEKKKADGSNYFFRTNTKGYIFSFLFIVHFFLPYVGGRFRVEVAVAFLCVGIVAFFAVTSLRLTRVEFKLAVLSVLCASATYAVLILNPNDLATKLILFTNYNFLGLALCGFVVFRKPLIKNRHILVLMLLIASLFINAIAIGQWIWPYSAFNKMIMQYYGGTPSEIAIKLGYSSFAEFLIIAAQRYTSIFNGMHVLALFDLLIIAISIAVWRCNISKSYLLKALLVLALAGACCGGILSSSKSFWLGMATMTVVYVFLKPNVKTVLLILILFIFLFIGIDILSMSERVTLLFDGNILATRYSSSGGYLQGSIEALSTNLFLFLLGAGSDVVSYRLHDSLYISPVIVGGFFYLLIYLAPILLMLKVNWQQHKCGSAWGTSFLAVHIAWLAIGIGIPTYQVGRIAPLFIILNLAFSIVPTKRLAPHVVV